MVGRWLAGNKFFKVVQIKKEGGPKKEEKEHVRDSQPGGVEKGQQPGDRWSPDHAGKRQGCLSKNKIKKERGMGTAQLRALGDSRKGSVDRKDDGQPLYEKEEGGVFAGKKNKG